MLCVCVLCNAVYCRVLWVVRYVLVAMSWLLSVVSCVAVRRLYVACCGLLVCCLLPVACCVRPAMCYVLYVSGCVLVVVCCVVFGVFCVLYVDRYERCGF